MSKIQQLFGAIAVIIGKYPNNIHHGGVEFNGTCKYTMGTNTDCPELGCVVGQGIKEVDPELYAKIREEENRLVNDPQLKSKSCGAFYNYGAERIIKHMMPDGVIPSEDNKFVSAIERLQSWQDQEAPWGKCLAEANKLLSTY